MAVGWSGYIVTLQTAINQAFGSTYEFDKRFVNAPVLWLEQGDSIPWKQGEVAEYSGFVNQLVIGPDGNFTNAIINVPAILITLFLTFLLIYGVKESARFNNLMVIFKLTVVVVMKI